MKYNHYKANDLLKDEFFVQWVIHPDSESDYFWKNWMEKHPEKRSEIMTAREIILSLRYKNKHYLESGKADQILGSILHQPSRNTASNSFYKVSYKIAASLFIILLVGFSLWYYSDKSAISDPVSVSTEPEWVIREVPAGQKSTLKLPDGTIVRLNSEAVFSFKNPFDQDQRSVQLEGEAFFEVAPDHDKPFVIQTGEVKTTVLGTSFNVFYNESTTEVSVAVVEGKVQVKIPNGQAHVLLPTEMAVYNQSTSIIDRSTFNLKKVTAWRDGILFFDNEPLHLVFQRLEKWYGVDIDVATGRMPIGKYSGEFKNESLEVVLEGIAFTSDFEYDFMESKKVQIR
ncbi:MAG: FecR family protein [Candidatus Cyclobacteriaceae bacterium M3_2C_046]